MFICGFAFCYLATRNTFSVPLIFGVFYFLATFLSADKVFLVASISFISLGFGSIIYNIVFNASPRRLLAEFRTKPFVNDKAPKCWSVYPLMVLFLLSLLVTIYYYSKVGISLFSLDVGYDRLINRYSIPGARVMQRFFRVYLPVCVICYSLFKYSPHLKKYYSPTILLTIVAVASFFLIAGGMRGNIVIFLFIPFIYIWSLVTKPKMLPLILTFTGTFLLGILVTLKMYSGVSAQVLFMILFSRFTTGASDGLSVIVGGYTENTGLQLGYSYFADVASLFSKLGLINTKFVTLGEEIAQNLLGSRYNGERAAVYFSGELFHNFGYLGLVIGSIFIGYLLQYLYIKTLKSRKDMLHLSIYGFITAAFNSILGGPVIATIIDYATVLLLFIILITLSNYIFGITNRRIYVLGYWLKK